MRLLQIIVIAVLVFAVTSISITGPLQAANADTGYDQSSVKFFKKCDKAVEKNSQEKEDKAEDQFKRHYEAGSASCF